MHLAKVWAAINKLSIIWKSDVSDIISCFLPNCGCVNAIIWLYHMDTNKTNWEKARWVHTRMLCGDLKKSWLQPPTKEQLYGHLPSVSQTIPVRQTRALLEKQGQTYKQSSSMDSYIQLCHCWLTSKNLHLSTLCRYWM